MTTGILTYNSLNSKKMKHLIVLLVLFCFGITNAQQQKDVLYLKNGSIIKGTITEMNPSTGLKIKTADGSLFVFSMDEVEKMEKETVEETVLEKEVAKPSETQSSQPTYHSINYELGKVHLGFQPAGFLQFGPVLELHFRIGDNFVLGPQVRFTSLGLAYHAVTDFEATMVGISAGVSFKHFLNKSQENKFYYGFGIEWEYGETEGHDGDWYGNHGGLVFTANAGYRFRFSSGFYINLGAYAGVYQNVWDVWYYYDDDIEHVSEDEDGIARFFGYLEFGIGVEF